MADFVFCFTQNLNKLAALVRGELPKLTRNILCALITIDVHARDIVTGMVAHQVIAFNQNCYKRVFKLHSTVLWENEYQAKVLLKWFI